MGSRATDGLASSWQVIAATNRVDILDPALLRSGRIDRKVEFKLPTEEACARIMQIHSRKMNCSPDVNYEELGRCCDDFNGAQLKAVCVEAGMLALRRERHVDAASGSATAAGFSAGGACDIVALCACHLRRHDTGRPGGGRCCDGPTTPTSSGGGGRAVSAHALAQLEHVRRRKRSERDQHA